ncbi:MAG: histidine phosphatase family protein [SAR202 cluster bacterium]|nr:histidine phosphatase family protein [SAR202 cluster bacterium]
MALIYIVRHGETEWNASGRIQGHTDVTLSEKGRRQAQILGRRLAQVPFHAAYASDLRRASETAKIILGERAVSLETTAQLREYQKGVFEGLTNDEIERRYPEQFAASVINDLDFAPTGGESIRQTTARLAEFVGQVRQRHLEGNVLLVGHGGSLRSAVVALLELPLEANWKFVMGNCALSIVETYSDNAVLRLYNDTSHLQGMR